MVLLVLQAEPMTKFIALPCREPGWYLQIAPNLPLEQWWLLFQEGREQQRPPTGDEENANTWQENAPNGLEK